MRLLRLQGFVASKEKSPHASLSGVPLHPAEKVDWLWEQRLPLGKCTLVAGEGGLGKSMVLAWIAATGSRGGDWPCGEGLSPCGSVIILSAEDDAADTIVPRLIAAERPLL